MASIEKKKYMDILHRTWGAWQRRKAAGKIVRRIRAAFQKSQERHKR
jgi:hypothetical protein